MTLIKKYFDWIPALFIAVILLSSLPFKFTGAAMPMHIFAVVGNFLGLEFFKVHGALIIGIVELFAGVLVLIPALRHLGALLTVGTMAGAIFFHLFSPLGVTVKWMQDGQMMESTSLFVTAVLSFVAGLYLLYKDREKLPFISGKAPVSQ